MTNAADTTRATIASASAIGDALNVIRTAVALVRERAVYEAAALLVPILLVGATQSRGPALWVVAAAYLSASGTIAFRSRARASRGAIGWISVRLVLAVAMVAVGQLLTGATGLLSAPYLLIIAMAAFGGPRLLMLAVVASLAAHLGVETIERGTYLGAAQRGLGFAAVAILVALGMHREVSRVARGRDRLRRAVRVDRRRARQIAGVEAIGRILAARGPTSEALDAVVGRVSGEFGYRYVSLYLGDERLVRLGAQRGYVDLIPTFSGERGIVGRVMRSRQPALIADVTADPEYWGLNPDVTSEICVPLLADQEFLGFVNVESIGHPLDGTDLRVMVAVADRLAAALIIGREREQLARRADLFRHLHGFSEAVNGTLQPEELFATIVRSISSVVEADLAALHLLERETGRYQLRAMEGSDQGGAVSDEARVGEGMAGRAIRDRSMIVDSIARADSGGVGSGPMPAVAIPLIRDGAVLGTLTLVRNEPERPFTDLERDALAMSAEQAALAVTNVYLHAEVAEMAVRDPLTGLFNRRYLDPALDQLFARRARLSTDERVPLAAIMFDLDHFSDLNNRHGHQVGDDVLRAFGTILKGRMRGADLVARFGGEEFAAILYRASLDDAVRIADEVREELSATRIAGAGGEEISATVSAGCAAVGPEQETPEDLLRAADVALYMAKRAGRDRVCAA